MLSLSASLTGEVAVVLLAVGVKRFPIALKRVDLSVLGQIVEEAINCRYTNFWILLGDFLVEFFRVEERIEGGKFLLDHLFLLGGAFHFILMIMVINKLYKFC